MIHWTSRIETWAVGLLRFGVGLGNSPAVPGKHYACVGSYIMNPYKTSWITYIWWNMKELDRCFTFFVILFLVSSLFFVSKFQAFASISELGVKSGSPVNQTHCQLSLNSSMNQSGGADPMMILSEDVTCFGKRWESQRLLHPTTTTTTTTTTNIGSRPQPPCPPPWLLWRLCFDRPGHPVPE